MRDISNLRSNEYNEYGYSSFFALLIPVGQILVTLYLISVTMMENSMGELLFLLWIICSCIPGIVIDLIGGAISLKAINKKQKFSPIALRLNQFTLAIKVITILVALGIFIWDFYY